MRRLFRLRFARRHLEAEVDEELAFHLAQRTQSLIDQGLTPDTARAEAERRFGPAESVRKDCLTLDQEREIAMQRATVFSDISQDVTYAARTLRRNPGFALVALATLALGIGANTAVFSLIDAVLLRKLDVASPEQLVIVGDPTRVTGLSTGGPRFDLLPYSVYTLLRERNKSFSGLMASGRTPRLYMTTAGQTEPENPRGRFVSGNFFSVLGIRSQVGRVFGPEEDRATGASATVVISDEYWRRRFEGDPSIVGRVLTINGMPLTIIGVAQAGFTGEVMSALYDVWLPLTMQPVIMPNQDLLADPLANWLLLMGRRLPSVSFEQVRSEFVVEVPRAFADIAKTPTFVQNLQRLKGTPIPISEGARGLSRTRAVYTTPLLTLMAGVGLLMLIVCANVSNLLLARATTRAREMSLRAALGAGRWRVMRQLLTESTVLALTGAVAGLAVGYWGSQMLLAVAADGGARIPVAVDLQGRVALFTVGVSALAVLLFGLAPALISSRVNLANAMRASGRSVAGGSMRGMSPARLVIVAQVALSLVLLVGASLFVRSMWALQHAETGLDRDHLLVADIETRSRGYVGPRFEPMMTELRGRIAAIPGVVGVSFSENGLYSGSESFGRVAIDGYNPLSRLDSVIAFDLVGPGYASAIGARVIEGRELDDRDRGPNATDILLNETAARAYFQGASALGKTIRIDAAAYRVAGVITDAQDHDLRVKPLRRAYIAYLSGFEYGPVRFIVRTAADPARLAPQVRKAIAAQDPGITVFSVDPLTAMLRSSIRAERLVAKLTGAFGVLALVLAAIGLYGVMNYAVSRRTNEIGVRMALGARRADVIRMIVVDGLGTIGIGIAIGLGLSLYLTKFLQGQLYGGVAPVDARSIAVAVLVLVSAGVFATLIPALRGSRVAPVESLREA